MISVHRPFIAREGWIFILLVLVCAWAVHTSVGKIEAIPVWLMAALFIYIFRDPNRTIPPIPLAVVSPVGGRIKSVNNAVDPYLERDAIAISMRMNFLGPYVVRSPMEGKVMNQWLGRMNLHKDESGANPPKQVSNNNTRNYYAIWIQSDEGDDVVLVLVKSIFGFRPRFHVQAGERVGQGRRCGYVNFGCKVLVLVPQGSRQDVKPGDSILAGTGVIATLIHK